MTNKIIVGAVCLSLFITFATPVFAITRNSTITPATEVKATPISADVVAKISCVGAAVNLREQVIDAAMTKFTLEFSSAYTVRADALKIAYSLKTAKDVKTAVKSAWTAFNTSTKTARKNWQTSKNSAWAQFKTSSAACKAPADTVDSANSSSEFSAN